LYPGENIRAAYSGKTSENGSSNTLIISGGGILPVPARINHNSKNPATGYNHCITASTFLPFSCGLLPDIHGIIALSTGR